MKHLNFINSGEKIKNNDNISPKSIQWLNLLLMKWNPPA